MEKENFRYATLSVEQLLQEVLDYAVADTQSLVTVKGTDGKEYCVDSVYRENATSVIIKLGKEI